MKKKTISAMAAAMAAMITLTGCSGLFTTSIDEGFPAEVVAEASSDTAEAAVDTAGDATTADDASTSVSVATDVATTASTQEAPKAYEDITNYDSAELMEGEALTADELKEFDKFFNEKGNYLYTITQYRTPDKIDLKGVAKEPDDPAIVCTEGVRSGDLTQVVVSYPGSTRYNRRVTLQETGDSTRPYEFYSCRQLWEAAADKIIEAPVNGTDETVTCGVILRFDLWTTEVDIIEDNKVDTVVYISPYIDEENRACDEVKELEFCDIDNDGDDDMIAICVYGKVIMPIICRCSTDKNGKRDIYLSSESYSGTLKENVSDLTADNVIRYILDHPELVN